MVLLIIIGILLFMMGWIVFTPLILTINTNTDDYTIRQRGTFRFWLSRELSPHLRILGISVPVKPSGKPKAIKPENKKRKQKSSIRSFPSLIELIRRILQSISIRYFRLDLDTDDVSLNARMVPLFLLMSRGPVQLATNFEGRVSLRFEAELKLYRIGWAFLLFITKK